jgi:hypothetical protein
MIPMYRYRAKEWKHSRPVRVNRRHWRKIAVALIGLDRPILNDGSGLISSVEPRHDRRLMSCGVFPRPLMILFVLGKKRLEAVANLSQFPENRKKLNCDYEQQKLGNHFLASSGKK